MPLLAPKVPEYQSHESPLRAIPFREAEVGPATVVGRAIELAGKRFEARGNEMQQERDTAVVGDLYNQWRDADRETLSNLLAKKGKDATNLQKDYDKFFTDSFNKKSSLAENQNQQQALKGIVDRKRDQNLDILARYEAQEGQRYLGEVENGIVGNFEKDSRASGFDDHGVAKNIAELFAWVDSAHAGEDTTALKQKYKSQMLFANMQERIDQNPDMASNALEAWKGDLGEGYLKLKQAIETKSKTHAIDQMQAELQSKYETNGVPDFTRMREALTKREGMADNVKFEVRQWLDAYEIQYKAKQQQSTSDAHDKEEQAIGNAFMDGKYSDVFNMVRKSQFLKGDEKYAWTERMKAAANAPVKIDPIYNAAAIVQTNDMIREGWPESEIKKAIITNPYLGKEDKEQYLNKLETKLGSDIEAGRREGYGLIQDMIFPKVAGPIKRISELVQSPEQINAIVEAENALDSWIQNELQSKRRPNITDIRKKALEVGQAAQTPMVKMIMKKQKEFLKLQDEAQK